jgi:hypothetical protein
MHDLPFAVSITVLVVVIEICKGDAVPTGGAWCCSSADCNYRFVSIFLFNFQTRHTHTHTHTHHLRGYCMHGLCECMSWATCPDCRADCDGGNGGKVYEDWPSNCQATCSYSTLESCGL